MLYHLHEMQNAALEPWRYAASANRKFLQTPFNPFSYTQPARAMAAACEIFEETTKRRGKPEFDLDPVEIDGKSVDLIEEVVLDKPFVGLKHFRRSIKRDDPKLLIVAPLSGHYATLLRGTVQAMAAEHDVYITEWRDARDVPVDQGKFDLDDYIDQVIEFLSFLGPDTHVLAVCQPSVPVLAAVAVMNADNDPCAPTTMTLMGGPIDTRINPTEVNQLAEDKPLSWFEKNAVSMVPMIYSGVMRRVYPGFLQLTGFMSMNLDRHIGAHMQLFHHLVEGDGESADQHRKFYDEYLSVMDLPAEYYLQTVKTVFQDHALPKGEMMWRDRLIDPADITKTALMTVEGELDDISGLGQTKAAQDLCVNLAKNQRLHYEQKGVGHYGVFNGRRWREQISPRITKFIRAQADRKA